MYMSSISQSIAEEIEKYQMEIEKLKRDISIMEERDRILQASLHQAQKHDAKTPTDRQMHAVVKGNEKVSYSVTMSS
jgi:hypothetical protein